MPTRAIGDKAIVIGAGVGGLCAAAALADFFENVLVLDRDELPEAAVPRAGVPQGRQLHALLGGGLQALESLFPGFERRIAAGGAVPMRVGLDFRYEMPGFNPFPRRDLGWIAHTLTRPLLELTIRQCLRRLTNVTIRPRCRVLELIVDADGENVTGVQAASADGHESLGADLTVDASGRGAPTLALLKRLGQPVPEESSIGIGLGYATASFAIPDPPLHDWLGVLTTPVPPLTRRAGALVPVEGNRWLVTLGGVLGDLPPDDPAEFAAFATTLATPTIAEAIRGMTPLGGIDRFVLAASTRRYFDRLAFFPRGLLTVGDALSQFNPLYGQGMSVRAQEGALLRRLLGRLSRDAADPLGRLAHAFFTEAQPLTETPWWNAALPDLIYPETTGERPPGFAAVLQYGEAIRRLAASDPEVHRLMMEVQHLMKPRSALTDPFLAVRVRAMMAPA